MARRILSFFVLLVLSFGLATYLILGEALDDLKADHAARQERVHQAIAAELSTSYVLLDALIRSRSGLYRQLHQRALYWVEQHGWQNDLSALQALLAEEAGFPVDIYLIGDDLVIENTSFEPDLGLDFKHPVFIDARKFLALAKAQRRILVGQPTLELTSRKYKLYSYSPAKGRGYLELGFIDPELNRYFETFIEASKSHPDVEVELFLENWGELLVRLGELPPAEGTTKIDAVEHEQKRLAREYESFRQTTRSGPRQRITRQMGDQAVTSYYSELLSVTLDAGLPMRFLSKVTFDNRWIAQIEEKFTQFYVALFALALGFMAVLMFLVRFRLVIPIQTMVQAMRTQQPIDTSGWHRMRELEFLADGYNRGLARNEEQFRQLETLSFSDPLTGLLNRRYLDQVFSHELARAARRGGELGFAMIDVDHFKAYNDLYGHRGGDQALKQVADRLTAHFRRATDFVFRVGGEEFAVLVTDPGDTPLPDQFERFRKALWEQSIPHHGSQSADTLTVSIGLAVINPGDMVTPDEVVECADQALYGAKERGRNRVVQAPRVVRSVRA